MHQIEILLPADDRFAAKRKALAHELASRFGGVTAFTRAPAKGLFEQKGKQVEDDIAVFEVMTDQLESHWWSSLRARLERLPSNKSSTVVTAPAAQHIDAVIAPQIVVMGATSDVFNRVEIVSRGIAVVCGIADQGNKYACRGSTVVRFIEALATVKRSAPPALELDVVVATR